MGFGSFIKKYVFDIELVYLDSSIKCCFSSMKSDSSTDQCFSSASYLTTSI
jgi:hypothetical protein